MTKIRDLVGFRSGRLTVKEFSHSNGDTVWWICQCDCGNVITVPRRSISRARSQQSCGCLKGESNRKRCWRGVGRIGMHFWTHIVSGASSRDIPFLISIEDGWNLYMAQNGKCALSGKEICFAPTSRKQDRSATTASLDRIDSTKAYELGNVQWVHKVVNIMKNKLEETDFVGWCASIASYAVLKNQPASAVEAA